MLFERSLRAALMALPLLVSATTGHADPQIEIRDAYARSSMASAATGAAFMELINTGTEDDRLIGATSDVAARVELHTHIQDANGVMMMREVEDGFAIPAGATHALKRGGDHVMFIGLNRALADGDSVALTLTFEKAGDVVLEVPVDLTR